MSAYFYLHSEHFFLKRFRPAMTEAWQARSFAPCVHVCAQLRAKTLDFAERHQFDVESFLVSQVVRGLEFDRWRWPALVGELLLHGAEEVPEIGFDLDSLCQLLESQMSANREQFTTIQRACCGSRDLAFGGKTYRPEGAGWNDSADVAFLAGYLDSLRPEDWTLTDLPAWKSEWAIDEREEELMYLRDWFPDLRELYQRARRESRIVVWEELS